MTKFTDRYGSLSNQLFRQLQSVIVFFLHIFFFFFLLSHFMQIHYYQSSCVSITIKKTIFNLNVLKKRKGKIIFLH